MIDSLTFLSRTPKGEPPAIQVLAGDEDFLKRQVVAVLTKWVLGAEEDSFGLSTYTGSDASFATVRSELETLPFLAPRRLVVVENADPFVSNFRTALEKYATAPAANGILVLEVNTWPANTRLAKQLNDSTIACKALDSRRLGSWCVQWATSRYGKQLSAAAAQLLVDLIGSELGQLDQELAKLASYVGQALRIEVADVDVLVGRSQAASVFKIFDALGAGRPADALTILDQLLVQGEDPFRILGAFSLQLRRLAQAAALIEQKVPVALAFDRVGIPAWPAARQSTEQQLRRLGIRRSRAVFDWLLETDLGFKGSSLLPPRTLLEQLIARLSGSSAATAGATR